MFTSTFMMLIVNEHSMQLNRAIGELGGSMKFWFMPLRIRKREYFNHKLLQLFRLWNT